VPSDVPDELPWTRLSNKSALLFHAMHLTSLVRRQNIYQHNTLQAPGVRLQGVADDEQLLVTDMEYADDASLCASSPEQLQDLINSFVAYCDKHGLPVTNPNK
jgi:hypothetical protein